MKLSLRRASTADLDILEDLERRCFDPPWSRKALAGELHADAPPCWIACDGAPQETGPQRSEVQGSEVQGSEAQGYIVFRQVLDECELLRVAVVPEARRHGLGRRLVEYGLDEQRRDGVLVCHLEVHVENHAAVRLYENLGFETVGRRRAYYPDGGDALLLRRDLGRDRGSISAPRTSSTPSSTEGI